MSNSIGFFYLAQRFIAGTGPLRRKLGRAMKLTLFVQSAGVVVAGLLPWAFVIAAGPARTVILVRHAERAGDADPSVGINETGRCRAMVLADMLSDPKVKSTYTSWLARTLSIKPEVVPAKDIDALVAKLRARTEDGAVLVVRHPNTIPVIVERLSGETEPNIADGEYDRMFVVTLIGPNEAKVVSANKTGHLRAYLQRGPDLVGCFADIVTI